MSALYGVQVKSDYTGLFYGACWTGNSWVVGGAAGGRSVTPVFRSTDGGPTWTEIALPSGWGTNILFGLASNGDGQVVAVGNNGKRAYSSNHGQTWTSASDDSVALYDVVYALGHFVCVGVSGRIATSPTGQTWTVRTSGTGNDLVGIAWDGGNNLIATGVNVFRINTSGSVSSWPSGGTTNGYRPCYEPVSNRFYFNTNSTGTIARVTPGSTTVNTHALAAFNGVNALNRTLSIDGKLLLNSLPDSSQMIEITISGTTHTFVMKLDTFGNAIVNPFAGASNNNNIVCLVGANGMVYMTQTASVSGVIRDKNGNPCSRDVHIFRRSDMTKFGKVTSNASTGAYTFNLPVGLEACVVAQSDDTAEGAVFNDQIMRVLPE